MWVNASHMLGRHSWHLPLPESSIIIIILFTFDPPEFINFSNLVRPDFFKASDVILLWDHYTLPIHSHHESMESRLNGRRRYRLRLRFQRKNFLKSSNEIPHRWHCLFYHGSIVWRWITIYRSVALTQFCGILFNFALYLPEPGASWQVSRPTLP